ncbi:gamma-glutamylcyclotransferase family protein [Lactonifactor longoviformis]|uniref:gamma-glutamylcyclotransferase family protein n=1 Tax=Lactonifactor longoviformis TaxID=341220 RepID=UPI0036F20BD1
MNGKRYYIAYGSNLSVKLMACYCPDAKVVGTGEIKDYALLFKGCATIEPRKGKRVPVLVWEISPEDEKSLDRYEGYPTFYYKKELTLPVQITGTEVRQELTAMVYIMNEKNRLASPSCYYYKVLADGYEDLGFDKAILEQALADSVGKHSAEAFLNGYLDDCRR